VWAPTGRSRPARSGEESLGPRDAHSSALDTARVPEHREALGAEDPCEGRRRFRDGRNACGDLTAASPGVRAGREQR
jgi:hypothetical protein